MERQLSTSEMDNSAIRGFILTLVIDLMMLLKFILNLESSSTISKLVKHLMKLAGFAFLLFSLIACQLHAAPTTDLIKIQSVVVDGKSLSLRSGRKLNLGSSPQNIVFNFGSAGSNFPPYLRLRCRLDGFENNWHEGDGFMYLGVRFFKADGDQLGQKNFQVSGESAGWNGSLKSAPLTHRRETLVVPPKAARASVVISSAGPPSTIGIYVVANVVMMKSSSNSKSSILIQSPFDQLQESNGLTPEPLAGWIRDGTHASMAKIVQIGSDLPVKAFAIEDDDSFAHAEWRLLGQMGAPVVSGDHLVVEWNEMFSIGEGEENFHSVRYVNLPSGNYRFRVAGVDLMGNPDGTEVSLDVFVSQPFWERPWFWSTMLVFVMAVIMGSGRYLVWRRMKHEMLRLKNQQALESERLRIAHDIHDDLGARVTQITMVSAMSLHDSTLSEKTREELNQIKRISRDLVTALYETVWAVNPEYDNLDALGSYLCQIVNQQCNRTQFHCRLHVSELPHEIQVSSQIRHNIIMAVKEAIHNVIKHADGSEVVMNVTWNKSRLDIAIQDNGRGFETKGGRIGSGLTNMKKRMQDIGGGYSIESHPGAGTTVRFYIVIKH